MKESLILFLIACSSIFALGAGKISSPIEKQRNESIPLEQKGENYYLLRKPRNLKKTISFFRRSTRKEEQQRKEKYAYNYEISFNFSSPEKSIEFAGKKFYRKGVLTISGKNTIFKYDFDKNIYEKKLTIPFEGKVLLEIFAGETPYIVTKSSAPSCIVETYAPGNYTKFTQYAKIDLKKATECQLECNIYFKREKNNIVLTLKDFITGISNDKTPIHGAEPYPVFDFKKSVMHEGKQLQYVIPLFRFCCNVVIVWNIYL